MALAAEAQMNVLGSWGVYATLNINMAKPGKSAKKTGEKGQDSEGPIAVNRKAGFDYEVLQTVEAGLVLTGTEIKAIRERHVNLQDSFARHQNGEVWMYGCNIAPYSAGNRYNHEPTRPRKLLLHKWQIRDLAKEVQKTEGATLVPLRLYIKDHRAKVLLGLARGRRKYDKRQVLAKRDAEREMRREVHSRG